MNRISGFMNRADLSKFPSEENYSSEETMLSPVSEEGSSRRDPHLLFAPQHYTPSYDYPLIVWLHGSRSSERELGDLMPHLSLQNYAAVAPRGTKAVEACGHRYTWGQTPSAIALAEELVFGAIEAAREQLSIASDKIFLAGYGDGGSMAWRIGLRYAESFAGVASICGSFPKNHRPLARIAQARKLKTLWMLGARSKDCGLKALTEELPVLHSAGLKVAIRQYDCGNELYTDMLQDLNHWLMSIVTNQPMVEPEREASWSSLNHQN